MFFLLPEFADTFLRDDGLSSRRFELEGFEGDPVVGGEYNYIAVGMMSGHYLADSEPLVYGQSAVWNLKQEFLDEGQAGDHNYTQIIAGARWAEYGRNYYHANTPADEEPTFWGAAGQRLRNERVLREAQR